MPRFLKTAIVFLCIGVFSNLTYADPWFTGPILAQAGRNMPRGHTNFELYAFEVLTDGQYDDSGKINPIPLFKSLVFNPLLTHGFTDWLDIQLSIPYTFNSTQKENYHRIADTSLGAGFQLYSPKEESKWTPYVRLFIQETFPTGKYDHLNPALLGVDSTGLGTYRTQIALNLQHLIEVFDAHYLRTRLILSRLYSSTVDVSGLNSFGGTVNTHGVVAPGPQDNMDLSFEFTLTQNWVAVMEGYIARGQSTHFNGILDIVSDGATDLLTNQSHEVGLAPAIEYNFTENVGIIGGVWFPVKGQNISHYTTYVLALNAYW